MRVGQTIEHTSAVAFRLNLIHTQVGVHGYMTKSGAHHHSPGGRAAQILLGWEGTLPTRRAQTVMAVSSNAMFGIEECISDAHIFVMRAHCKPADDRETDKNLDQHAAKLGPTLQCIP